MKKYISLAILLIMLLLLCPACGVQNEQTTPPEDTKASVTTAPAEETTGTAGDGIDYILPPKNISYELDSPYVYDAPSGVLLRFDIKRKRAMIACPDPLCDHGEKCPVNGIYNIAVAKDYIYFRKSFTDIYCYRLAENKVKNIFRTNGMLSTQFVPIGNRMYFSSCEYEIDKTNGSISRQIWNFYRYDAELDKTEKLSKEPIPSELVVSSAKNGRLYFEENGKYFSTNMDFEDRREGRDIQSADNFSLDVEFKEGMNLIKVDKETGSRDVIARRISSLRAAYLGDPTNNDDGYLCYGWLYIAEELNEKNEPIPLNQLNFIDKETFSSKVIWEGEAPLHLVSAWQEGKNSLCSGGYIGLRVQHLADGMITNGLLVVNPVKNEAFVILCEQTRRKAAKPAE